MKYNLTEKDLCNVCDDQCEKKHPYFGGDYEENIRFYKLGNYFYSFIAIHPPQDENVCFFCISYYNQSTQMYTLDATLMINNRLKTNNNAGRWTIKELDILKNTNGKVRKYEVISNSSKSGKILIFLYFITFGY